MILTVASDSDCEDWDDSVSMAGSVAESVAKSVAISVAESTASSSIDSTTGERKECWFCFENKPSALLLPCSHMTLCFKCASEHFDKGGVCPKCQQPFDQVIHVAGVRSKRKGNGKQRA